MDTPTKTSRQIRNRALRDMGILSRESYHTEQLGPGDEVQCCQVTAAPQCPEQRYHAVILKVQDHGWYLIVHVRHDEPGDRDAEKITLMRDGPPDWGVIEFRITRKVHCPIRPVTTADGGDRRDWFWTPQGKMKL